MFLMLFNFVLNVVLVCFPSFSATI